MSVLRPPVRSPVYYPVHSVTNYGWEGGFNAAIGRWQPNTTEPITQATPTIYVDSSATGLGDGSSWTNAYTTYAAAYTAASNGDVISVSGGTSGKTYAEYINTAKNITVQGSTDSGHDGQVYFNERLYVHNTGGTFTLNNVKIGIIGTSGRVLRFDNGSALTANNVIFGRSSTVNSTSLPRS